MSTLHYYNRDGGTSSTVVGVDPLTKQAVYGLISRTVKQQQQEILIQPQQEKLKQHQQENLKQPGWYSFDKVSADYSGPVVEGWPPSKSRWMPLYIRPEEDSFLIRPEVDLDKTRIIVIVHSGTRLERRRKANRDSWIKSSGAGCSRNCYKRVRVIFHIGASENKTLMEQIAEEAKIHMDILQVGEWTLDTI